MFRPLAAALFALAPFVAAAAAAEEAPSAPPLEGPRGLVDRETAALRAVFGDGAPGGVLDAALARRGDAVLDDLVEWRRLRESEVADWATLRAFVERRPTWPDAATLRRRAEQTMPDGLAASEVFRFFQSQPPLSARGARRLGEALIDRGQVSSGRAAIVEAWRTRVMPRAESEIFLARHGALIAPHSADRVKMLFWRERLTAAKRLVRQLPADEQRLLLAKIALIRGERGVDRFVSSVPQALQNDPGLIYARFVWRAKRKRHTEAESLLRSASASDGLGEPSAWAKRRLYYAREAYEAGRPEDAFALAAEHGLASGRDFADLEWFAGWIALRHLGEPARALERFERLWDAVSTPISRGRAAYWAGEAAAALPDAAAAAMWRARAAEFAHVFYGQLARDATRAGPFDFASDRDRRVDARAATAPSDADDLAAAAAILYRLGQRSDARRFLRRLAETRDSLQGLQDAAAIARRHSDPTGEIRVAKTARGMDVDLWAALFPAPASFELANSRVEPALLLAVARQESAFLADATSSAGALGLMQMMPRTARTTARRVGLPFDRNRLLDDPAYNLTLADAHLAELLAEYRGSYALTAAAYNAGGSNVSNWIDRFGDPRDPDVDVVTWIESIPFSETRNYVQRVLESVQVYRARLTGRSTATSLTRDLNR